MSFNSERLSPVLFVAVSQKNTGQALRAIRREVNALILKSPFSPNHQLYKNNVANLQQIIRQKTSLA